MLAYRVRPDMLATMKLGDVPPSPELDRLRARRIELGVPTDDDGTGIDRDDGRVHLHRTRTVRVSIDTNGDYCRPLPEQRYGAVAASN
jgi:hypothetical protein